MSEPAARIDPLNITVLIAHGSRNPNAGAEHEEMCRRVAARAESTMGAAADVRPAYLEISSPSISEAIETAVDGGATSITLVPHFLYSGNHVAVDIPAIVDAARAAHPDVTIRLTEHSGADPAMVDLLAARLSG